MDLVEEIARAIDPRAFAIIHTPCYGHSKRKNIEDRKVRAFSIARRIVDRHQYKTVPTVGLVFMTEPPKRPRVDKAQHEMYEFLVKTSLRAAHTGITKRLGWIRARKSQVKKLGELSVAMLEAYKQADYREVDQLNNQINKIVNSRASDIYS